MVLKIKHANETTFEFKTKNAFAKDDGELIILGFNYQHNQLECKGIKIHNDIVYLYGIKYESKRLYESILKFKIGKQIELRSDISQCMWEKQIFKKIDIEPVEKLLSLYDDFRVAMKMSRGILIPGNDTQIMLGDKVMDVKEWKKL